MISLVPTVKFVTVELSEGQKLCFGKKYVFSSQTRNMLYNTILGPYTAISKSVYEKANNLSRIVRNNHA